MVVRFRRTTDTALMFYMAFRLDKRMATNRQDKGAHLTSNAIVARKLSKRARAAHCGQ
jgi:hypothetical protein